MNVPLVADRRIYNSSLTPLHIPPASHTMAKRKNVPADANVLDMRHPKMSRPRGNAPASSDVAIPSTPSASSGVAIPGITSASQPISGVPLDAVPEYQRVALMTYPVELRPCILPMKAILTSRMIRPLRNA